jgi:hypothetical protein
MKHPLMLCFLPHAPVLFLLHICSAGNAAFASKDYPEAIRLYTEAIDLVRHCLSTDTGALLLCNR